MDHFRSQSLNFQHYKNSGINYVITDSANESSLGQYNRNLQFSKSILKTANVAEHCRGEDFLQLMENRFMSVH